MAQPIDEGRWLTCVEPFRMLDWLRENNRLPGARKLRLFACACCRSVERRITLQPCRKAVTVAERFADGLATAANAAGSYSNRLDANFAAAQSADENALSAAKQVCAYAFASTKTRGLPPKPSEHLTQCGLIRCLFGNPFRPLPPIESSWMAWNGATVRKMAEALYQERGWGDLPVLADALEDAGCTDADLLNHLRGPGPHARGCHVLDALLGHA
jgi:hypothetical protein